MSDDSLYTWWAASATTIMGTGYFLFRRSCSGLIWALETAALAAEALGYSGEIERIRALEPDVSRYDVWDEIRRRVPDGPLLLVGHEPLLSALAAYLLNSPALLIDMKKSALVRVDCERAGPQPKCALKWIITPVTA